MEEAGEDRVENYPETPTNLLEFGWLQAELKPLYPLHEQQHVWSPFEKECNVWGRGGFSQDCLQSVVEQGKLL